MKAKFAALLLVLSTLFLLGLQQKANDYQITEIDSKQAINATLNQDNSSESVESFPIEEIEISTFSDEELKRLYNSLNFPNTKPIIERPSITGIKEIDDIIQRLAEERGYELREVPNTNLQKYKGLEMQNSALEDWQRLKADAENSGIIVEIRSAYRDIAAQRRLFLDQFNRLNISAANVSKQSSQSAIDNILALVAPPGYSRHHNGYTVDLFSPDYSVFEFSSAYTWLTKDNYNNAKKYGFIPSYPKKASNQGPNPEAWEFVWSDKFNLSR